MKYSSVNCIEAGQGPNLQHIISYFSFSSSQKKSQPNHIKQFGRCPDNVKDFLSKHLEDIPSSTDIKCTSHYMEAKRHVTSKHYVLKWKRNIESEKNSKKLE